jgi:hypothetical protein
MKLNKLINSRSNELFQFVFQLILGALLAVAIYLLVGIDIDKVYFLAVIFPMAAGLFCVFLSVSETKLRIAKISERIKLSYAESAKAIKISLIVLPGLILQKAQSANQLSIAAINSLMAAVSINIAIRLLTRPFICAKSAG